MTDTNTVPPVPTPPVAPVRDLSPMEQMRGTLTMMKDQFASALPPQINPDKFVRTALTAIQMQPDLLTCDRRSLLGGFMKAAQDGLLPDGREAAMVIFRSKGGPAAQYMPMIGGVLKKLRNSGELASINAHVVYAEDEFSYELGDNESITHRPKLSGERGPAVFAYAVAKMKDGSIYREIMPYAAVEKVRAVSRAKDSGPWVQWWDQMAEKTVLRRLCKRLPSSADVDAMFDNDDEATDFAQQPAKGVTIVKDTPSRLKAAMGLAVEIVDPEPASEAQTEPEAGGGVYE